MGEESEKAAKSNDSVIYYILGGVVLVGAVVGFFLLKPKTALPVGGVEQSAGVVPSVVTETPGPITAFTCDNSYYNPKIGFPEYYLSVEGTDTQNTGSVTCNFSVTVKDQQVATETVTAAYQVVPERGGSTYRCQTKAISLTPNVETDVTVSVTNPAGQEAECVKTFIFP